MNNTTALQDFANGCAGLLTNNVFPAVIKGIKDTKGVDVTLEELYKWCNLPMNRSLMPAMGFNGAVPTPVQNASTVAAKKKAGVKAEVKLLLNQDGTPMTSTGKPFIEGKSCRHFYEKGAVNAGKFCGKDVVKGTNYCSNKTHKDKENKQKVNPGVAPQVEIAEPEEDNGGLQVKWYDKSRGLLEEVNHHFIVKKEGEDVVVSVGKLHPDNTIKPLTENEKVIARALDITVPDLDEVEETQESTIQTKVSANVPQMPVTVPQMPVTVPQMPMTVPQMPMTVPQMPMSVPQMPMTVPQMPMSVPQMPRSVPQMPMGVPQMPKSVPLFPGTNPK